MNIAGLMKKKVDRSMRAGVSKEKPTEDHSKAKPPATVVDKEYAEWVLYEYYRGMGYDVRFSGSVVWALVGESWVNMDIREWVSMGLWSGGVGVYRIMHSLVSEVDRWLESMGCVLPSFRWRPHQIGEGTRLRGRILEEGWAVVMHMPRTGKTGTVLYALEGLEPMEVLIVTTKNGVKGLDGKGGWLGFIELARGGGWCSRHRYTVTTPHRISKLFDRAGTFDVVLLDESHKIYSEPKISPSKLWWAAKYVIGGARCVFVTATPHAQGINQMFMQLWLCEWSPFKAVGLKNFKEYFAVYGKPYTIVLGNGVAVPRYDVGDVEGVYALVGRGIMALSQEEVGFKEEFLPVDIPCYVELKDSTIRLINGYVRDEVMQVGDVMVHTMNSTDIAMRVHQIEGSTLKYVDVFSITDEATGIRRRDVKPMVYNWFLAGMEKVQYIKDRWGDVEGLCIMYHYVNEGKLLRREFKKAKIMQGVTHSEAIDLWMYDTMVVYSMNYSVATYIQRRDRQVHLTKRDKPIEVYYLLCKGLVSEEIYDAVVKRGEDCTYSKYGKLK